VRDEKIGWKSVSGDAPTRVSSESRDVEDGLARQCAR
jgi:hypothetical protein